MLQAPQHVSGRGCRPWHPGLPRPRLGLAGLPGRRRPVNTQNGRSPQPWTPATFTQCEHQLTLIFFFFFKLQITLCPPGGGPDPAASCQGRKAARASASPAPGKMGKVTCAEVCAVPASPSPSDPGPLRKFLGAESRGARAGRGWGVRVGPELGWGPTRARAPGPATPFQSNGPRAAGGGSSSPGAGPARRRSSPAPWMPSRCRFLGFFLFFPPR